MTTLTNVTTNNQKTVSKKSKIDFNTINYKELMTRMLNEKGTISDVYRAFYTYSFYNQCLAVWQLTELGLGITPILCRSKWLEKNRTVKADATPICLCQPIKRTYKEEEIDKVTGKKEKVTKSYTKFVYNPYWFSYDQTEGNDDFINEQVQVPNFNFDQALKKLKIEVIPYDSLDGNCQGYALTKKNQIALNPMAGHRDMTLLHEMAHCLLKHADVDYSSFRLVQEKFKLENELKEQYEYNKQGKDKKKELDVLIKDEIKRKLYSLEQKAKSYEHALKEVEAEATAFIIGSILGIDEQTLSDSRGYIQKWFSGHKNIPEINSQNIIRAVDKLLKAGVVKGK